jgi:hypothetical protein
MNSINSLPESKLVGRLSLASFVKISMLAALGTLPVIGALCLVTLSIGFVRTGFDISALELPPLGFSIFILLFQVIAFSVSMLLTAAISGLAGYPFYSWLCRRRDGIILRGKFWGRS